MKKLLLFTILVFGLYSLQAQVSAPAPSPKSKVEQMVGMTTVTYEYSRPGVKDRIIYGGLVPFNEMWRTGANKNTMFSFSTDVKIEGQELKEGSYALFTIPGEKEWEVIFYSDTENWGTPREWDEEKVAVRAKVQSEKMPVDVESFLINITDLRNSSASIELIWENTIVPIELWVPTDELVEASIEKTFAGASSGDYYTAARYYRDEGKDLHKALKWMNKSLEMGGEKFWVVRQKALILADMGDYKAAIASAARSMELAEEAGNSDYIRMNKESIAEWKSMTQ